MKTGKENLTDMSGVVLDNSVLLEQRASVFLEKSRNLYCFRVGDIGVTLEFTENAPTLQELFVSFLKRKKSGLQDTFH